jgi:hypothetical protein
VAERESTTISLSANGTRKPGDRQRSRPSRRPVSASKRVVEPSLRVSQSSPSRTIAPTTWKPPPE